MLTSRFLGGTFQGPAFVLGGPYEPGFSVGATVLTQLHCHTTQSDGSFSPAVVVSDYFGRGYECLAITDHNMQTTQPAGIDTPIPGNELGVGTSMVHIIALDSTYNTLAGETDPQTIIDNVRSGGGEAHVAHPNWIGTALSAGALAALTDYYGIEIHNGKVMGGASPGVNPVINPGFAVVKWDDVLASKRDTWAIAVDDLHQVDAFNTFDLGRVWVFVASNTAANIIAALVAGRFVADVGNYGVTPGYPARALASVSLTCSGATRMEAWGDAGLLEGVDTDTIDYEIDGSEDYVRLVAVGDYTETFGGTLPHPWTIYDGAWTVSGGTLRLVSDQTAKHIILPRHREGDFTASVDMWLDDDQTTEAALFMFNVLNIDYRYLLRIGTSSDPAANNKLLLQQTTNGSTGNLTSANYTATPQVWHRLEVDYTASTGRIRAKVYEVGDPDPGWMIDTNDTDWTWGGFGFRANWEAQYDNLYINGFRTYYQPMTVDPV